MPFIGFLQKLPRIACLALPFGLFAVSAAEAQFLDDSAALTKAITGMRPSFGDRPRVLKIEIDNNSIDIEVQDPANRSHVDEWTYRLVELGPIEIPRMSGPTPVQLQLVDPDLEANLFNLDDIDFSAAGTLEIAAIHRANLQDPAGITRIEIARRVHILPKPKADDVQWSLHMTTGRESADVYADAKGNINGADLSETRNAKTFNLFKEPAIASQAATAFRDTLGTKPILMSVDLELQSVGFITNQSDPVMGQIMPGMPSVSSYSWTLNGLQQRIGTIAMPDHPDMRAPTPFAIDDVDWAAIGKLGADALAKVAVPKAEISEMQLRKSARHPGAPVLEWTISIVDPDGATSKVYVDAKGAITEVVLPPGKQAAAGPVNWLDPATMVGALSRLGASFPPETKIANVVFDDRGGRIVIEDAANGGHLATFEFTATGVERGSITMSLGSDGPRLRIADLTGLTAARLAALEQAAMTKLAHRKKAYLNSLTIGPNMFDPQAGAKAVDIYLRDIPVNSAQAGYAWGLYSFDGKYIDGVAF